jgi:hypothetical protein
MRGIKLLVLAAVTVVMCIFAAPAIADETIVLCMVNEETCKAETYAGEAFTASHVAHFDFGELGEVSCATTMSRDGAGQIKALSFSGCGEGCAVKPIGLPYKAELANPSAGDGEINISDGGSGEPKLGVTCGGIECVYGLGVVEAELEGGKPAIVVVSESMARQTESFFCPKTAEWNTTYYVSSPLSALYIVDRAIEGPVFCEIEEEICPQESIIEYALFGLQPKSTLTVTKLVGGAITCSESDFLLHDVENPYIEGPWRYKVGLIDECTHPTYSECELAREAPTYYANMFPFGTGDGEIGVVAGTSKEEPALGIECVVEKIPFTCVYSTEEIWLEFAGGEPGTIHELGLMARVSGSKTFCPVSVSVEADYEVDETGTGTTLYLTES